MAIMKSEQIMSESTKSFEDAIQTAVTRFDATVKGLASAWFAGLDGFVRHRYASRLFRTACRNMDAQRDAIILKAVSFDRNAPQRVR